MTETYQASYWVYHYDIETITIIFKYNPYWTFFSTLCIFFSLAASVLKPDLNHLCFLTNQPYTLFPKANFLWKVQKIPLSCLLHCHSITTTTSAATTTTKMEIKFPHLLTIIIQWLSQQIWKGIKLRWRLRQLHPENREKVEVIFFKR